MNKLTASLSIATLVLTVAGCASTGTPQVTHDGLVAVPKSEFKEVYMKPGVDLAQFSQYGVDDCTVAFKKNWLRDQNKSRIDLSNRVTQKDVDRIKDSLAERCDTHFQEALLKPPAYNLVESFDEGENVLVIQPHIIDLDVNAPDVRTAGITRSYTTSAGEMTLMLELVDGTTGEVLARVIDKRRDPEEFRLQWTNSVTNKADADRILRRWSKKLRESLDQAHQPQ